MSVDTGWTIGPTIPPNSPEKRLHVDCRLYIGCLAWQNDSSESQALKAWGLSCPKDQMCNTTCRGNTCTTEWGPGGEYIASDGHTMHLTAHDLPRPPLEPTDYVVYGAAFVLFSVGLMLLSIIARGAVDYIRDWCEPDERSADSAEAKP